MTSSGGEPLPTRLVIDTSAYSHLRRGDERVIEAVGDAEAVYVPATVLGELEAGFRIGRRYRENAHALSGFLREATVHVVPTTADVARRYGEVFARLRTAGTPIPVNDVWIAAATLSCGAHLVTFDSDFARVERLPHTVLTPAS